MGLFANARTWIDSIALGKESSSRIERFHAFSLFSLTSAFHTMMKMLYHRAIKLSKQQVFGPAGVFRHIQTKLLKFLLHEPVFVLEQSCIVTIGKLRQ